MVFDVLWLDGHSTCELPYTDRRAVLERLGLAGPAWQTPPTALRHRRARARDRRAARARGRRRQAPRQHVPPGEAGRRVAQGQAHPRPGARGRRLAPGRGTVGRPARFAARRLPRHGGRPRRAALRRPRRLRHRRCPARSARDAAAAVAASDVALRRRAPPRRRGVGGTRSWWSRSRSTSGRVPASCARRATAAYATTNPRPTSYARPDRSQYRPAVTDDLAALDATAQAALVRDGAASPRELVDAALGAHRRGEPAAQRGDPPARRARPRRGRRRRARRSVPRRAGAGEGPRRRPRRRTAPPRQPAAA